MGCCPFLKLFSPKYNDDQVKKQLQSKLTSSRVKLEQSKQNIKINLQKQHLEQQYASQNQLNQSKLKYIQPKEESSNLLQIKDQVSSALQNQNQQNLYIPVAQSIINIKISGDPLNQTIRKPHTIQNAGDNLSQGQSIIQQNNLRETVNPQNKNKNKHQLKPQRNINQTRTNNFGFAQLPPNNAIDNSKFITKFQSKLDVKQDKQQAFTGKYSNKNNNNKNQYKCEDKNKNKYKYKYENKPAERSDDKCQYLKEEITPNNQVCKVCINHTPERCQLNECSEICLQFQKNTYQQVRARQFKDSKNKNKNKKKKNSEIQCCQQGKPIYQSALSLLDKGKINQSQQDKEKNSSPEKRKNIKKYKNEQKNIESNKTNNQQSNFIKQQIQQKQQDDNQLYDKQVDQNEDYFYSLQKVSHRCSYDLNCNCFQYQYQKCFIENCHKICVQKKNGMLSQKQELKCMMDDHNNNNMLRGPYKISPDQIEYNQIYFKNTQQQQQNQNQNQQNSIIHHREDLQLAKLIISKLIPQKNQNKFIVEETSQQKQFQKIPNLQFIPFAAFPPPPLDQSNSQTPLQNNQNNAFIGKIWPQKSQDIYENSSNSENQPVKKIFRTLKQLFFEFVKRFNHEKRERQNQINGQINQLQTVSIQSRIKIHRCQCKKTQCSTNNCLCRKNSQLCSTECGCAQCFNFQKIKMESKIMELFLYSRKQNHNYWKNQRIKALKAQIARKKQEQANRQQLENNLKDKKQSQ